MKKILINTFYLLLFTGCSTQSFKPDVLSERIPASSDQENCKTLVSSIINKNLSAKKVSPFEATPEKKITVLELKRKGILQLKERFLILNSPKVDWFNSARESLISHMKTWNKNRYPIFYLSKEKNYQKIGAQLSDLLEKQSKGLASDEETKLLTVVMKDIEIFSNYQKDIEGIINERLSLQYTIDVLEKVQLGDGPIDISIEIKKATGVVKEVVTLRKSDHNRRLVLNKYRNQLKALNGRLFQMGAIEDRVLKQAYLRDIVTIYHREVEYAVKNEIHLTPELSKLYSILDDALKNSDFEPSSYGMFKVDGNVLSSEIMRLTKADTGVTKVIESKDKLKSSFSSYFKTQSEGLDPQKVGLFQHMYLSVANLTVGDLTRYGVVAVAAVGASRYFLVDSKSTVLTGTTGEVTPINPAETSANTSNETGGSTVHEVQVDNTQKAQESFLRSQYNVIQSKINELLN